MESAFACSNLLYAAIWLIRATTLDAVFSLVSTSAYEVVTHLVYRRISVDAEDNKTLTCKQAKSLVEVFDNNSTLAHHVHDLTINLLHKEKPCCGIWPVTMTRLVNACQPIKLCLNADLDFKACLPLVTRQDSKLCSCRHSRQMRRIAIAYTTGSSC